MEDIRSILNLYQKKKVTQESPSNSEASFEKPTYSEIPDIFFDDILLNKKLTRIEFAVLMYLYRQTWCRPNIYREHGIGPLNSYNDLSKNLGLSLDEINQGLRSLEKLQLIQTIRAGQYFIRKYFTEEHDSRYGQFYEFE